MTFFAASCDTLETNKEFAESLSLDYPLLSDPHKTIAKAYGVVTPERELPHRWTYYIGPDGKILYIDKNVTPMSAGEDIAARLKELGVPTTD